MQQEFAPEILPWLPLSLQDSERCRLVRNLYAWLLFFSSLALVPRSSMCPPAALSIVTNIVYVGTLNTASLTQTQNDNNTVAYLGGNGGKCPGCHTYIGGNASLAPSHLFNPLLLMKKEDGTESCQEWPCFVAHLVSGP